MSNDSTSRFSTKVENYIKYRPHYPEAVLDYLKSENILLDNSIIADIGSGTGISTEMFLKNGNKVYGVEPNQSMREAAEWLLAEYKNFTSINGTAEETTLDDSSIDLIVSGQAFHWFDIEKTKSEFTRILKPVGNIVLLWNARQLDTTPFLKDYEDLLLKYGTDYNEIRHENTDEKVFDRFFAKYKVTKFENEQIFNFDGVKGRLLSSSYIPPEGSPLLSQMLEELRKIYDKFNENDKVQIKYTTEVVSGSL